MSAKLCFVSVDRLRALPAVAGVTELPRQVSDQAGKQFAPSRSTSHRLSAYSLPRRVFPSIPFILRLGKVSHSLVRVSSCCL